MIPFFSVDEVDIEAAMFDASNNVLGTLTHTIPHILQ